MLQEITPYLPYYPYMIGGVFTLSLLMLLIAWYNLRRQHTAEIWRVRHNAGKRGGKLLLASLVMLLTTTIIAIFSGVIIYSFDWIDEFFPPRNPYGVQGVAISYLPTPTRGTIMPPHTVLARLGVTAPPATEQPVSDMLLTVQGVQDNPSTQATTTILDQTNDLFFNVAYEKMVDGLTWSSILYYNGEPLQAQASLWDWGRSGSEYLHFQQRNGYSTGSYELQIFLDDNLIHRFTFEIANLEDQQE